MKDSVTNLSAARSLSASLLPVLVVILYVFKLHSVKSYVSDHCLLFAYGISTGLVPWVKIIISFFHFIYGQYHIFAASLGVMVLDIIEVAWQPCSQTKLF